MKRLLMSRSPGCFEEILRQRLAFEAATYIERTNRAVAEHRIEFGAATLDSTPPTISQRRSQPERAFGTRLRVVQDHDPIVGGRLNFCRVPHDHGHDVSFRERV